MHVETWVWWTTIIVTVGFLLFDVFVIGRRPHEPSMKEVSWSLAGYVGAAVLFGSASTTSTACSTAPSSSPAG